MSTEPPWKEVYISIQKYMCTDVYVCMYVCMHTYMHTYIHIWLWIKTRVVAGPPSDTSLCRGRLVRTPCSGFLAAMIKALPQGNAVFLGGVVAQGVVAEHPRLLQNYVVKWLPKPVTNPVFLNVFDLLPFTYIYYIESIYIYIHIYTGHPGAGGLKRPEAEAELVKLRCCW